MINSKQQEKWGRFYDEVPEILKNVKKAGRVATAFNANVDAVIKISGNKLSELASSVNWSADDFNNTSTEIKSFKDVVRGIIKCFVHGIAEEWLCEDYKTFEKMRSELGYDRLQMGGQGGIVANAMAVLGVSKVYAHTASHSKLQANQFIKAENLFAIDDNGNLNKACDIERQGDVDLIHWIIEFDVGDKLILNGKEYVCPKSNRFIATYDPANMIMLKNKGFLKYLDEDGFDYMVLSGYHALTSANGGVDRVKETVELIKKWKAKNPHALIHLELASTQDIKVREAIIRYIVPIVDSIGLNEREALEAIQVINPVKFAEINGEKLSVECLFDILMQIKQSSNVPRIQLHFFGMYMTLQNDNFRVSPEQNKRGMMLAAVVAASKAGTGKIEEYESLLWAHGLPVCERGLEELHKLSVYLDCAELEECGICGYLEFDVIAVPTILVDKPLTLVGMGDTISSISLVGAR